MVGLNRPLNRRVRKLEVRLASMRTDAAPSATEAVAQMLAAGDWECALSFLDRGAFDTRQQRQLIEHWTSGPRALIDLDTTDLTRMRQTFDGSLGHLTREQRSDIAQRLLAASIE